MSKTGAIITIGDELLAGDVENTNALWLATQLTNRGVSVYEIRVVPDDINRIAKAVRELSQECTFVITTGGLGSTPDDITTSAIAEALSVPVEPHPEARCDIQTSVDDIRQEHPEFNHDIDRACRYPTNATIVPNEEGISPGCICENVYVLPGIPTEMKAVFEHIRDEFSGPIQSESLYADTPESHLAPILETVRNKFDVRVGCYPTDDHKRIQLVSVDTEALFKAREWIHSHSAVELITLSDTDSDSDDSNSTQRID
jgi:nicotinamide-nucleotide amidase